MMHGLFHTRRASFVAIRRQNRMAARASHGFQDLSVASRDDGVVDGWRQQGSAAYVLDQGYAGNRYQRLAWKT
jgi:hypothetical protein